MFGTYHSEHKVTQLLFIEVQLDHSICLNFSDISSLFFPSKVVSTLSSKHSLTTYASEKHPGHSERSFSCWHLQLYRSYKQCWLIFWMISTVLHLCILWIQLDNVQKGVLGVSVILHCHSLQNRGICVV